MSKMVLVAAFFAVARAVEEVENANKSAPLPQMVKAASYSHPPPPKVVRRPRRHSWTGPGMKAEEADILKKQAKTLAKKIKADKRMEKALKKANSNPNLDVRLSVIPTMPKKAWRYKRGACTASYFKGNAITNHVPAKHADPAWRKLSVLEVPEKISEDFRIKKADVVVPRNELPLYEEHLKKTGDLKRREELVIKNMVLRRTKDDTGMARKDKMKILMDKTNVALVKEKKAFYKSEEFVNGSFFEDRFRRRSMIRPRRPTFSRGPAVLLRRRLLRLRHARRIYM